MKWYSFRWSSSTARRSTTSQVDTASSPLRGKGTRVIIGEIVRRRRINCRGCVAWSSTVWYWIALKFQYQTTVSRQTAKTPKQLRPSEWDNVVGNKYRYVHYTLLLYYLHLHRTFPFFFSITDHATKMERRRLRSHRRASIVQLVGQRAVTGRIPAMEAHLHADYAVVLRNTSHVERCFRLYSATHVWQRNVSTGTGIYATDW
jgi:hypothetical protein